MTTLRPDIYSFANLGDLSLSTKSREMGRPFRTVAVEGNIGCGKTTFLEYFKTLSGMEVIAEPVEKWKNVNGFNCFEMMYKNTERWSQAFQSYLTLTMLEIHEQEEKQDHVKMMERTIYSARYCFIENLRQKNLMSDVEYAVLSEWHDWLYDNAATGIDLIVYLQASAETCQKRIKIRSRSEESSVSLEYLQDLHTLHEDWLVHKKRGRLPAPVLVIDADKDISELTKAFEQLAPVIMSLGHS